jgi:hypothetical protein
MWDLNMVGFMQIFTFLLTVVGSLLVKLLIRTIYPK